MRNASEAAVVRFSDTTKQADSLPRSAALPLSTLTYRLAVTALPTCAHTNNFDAVGSGRFGATPGLIGSSAAKHQLIEPIARFVHPLPVSGRGVSLHRRYADQVP